MGEDLWSTIKKTIGTIAPVLGNAIMPGVGGVAGSLLASVLGVNNEPAAINAALVNATPEQITAIKKLEMDHQEKLVALGIEQDKLYIGDVQSARQREVDVVKATGKKDVNLYILAWTVVSGFFALTGMLMFVTLPDKNIGPVNQLFGTLGTGFGLVLGYFFGSSKSSSDKTALLAARPTDKG